MAQIGRFILGAILGGLFAAAVVILLTPTPGSDMRKRFNSRLEEMRNEVKMASENRRKELELELGKLQHPEKQ
jgi:gas vesicle protein